MRRAARRVPTVVRPVVSRNDVAGLVAGEATAPWFDLERAAAQARPSEGGGVEALRVR